MSQPKSLEPMVLQELPLVTECPLAALTLPETPNHLFYVRNHFPTPQGDGETWQLHVTGLVQQPLTLSLDRLQDMPQHEVTVTLECAGFARRFLPKWAEGNQFGYGPVSSATFRGVRLADILAQAGLTESVRDIVFVGADHGQAAGQARAFERSLTPDVATQPDILVAWLMNGEPLPAEHGYPLRLVIPKWYGVASVKWLTEIKAMGEPFQGHYQVNAYVIERNQAGELAREPLTLMRPMSLVLNPTEGEQVARGLVTVEGIAWTGAEALTTVELSSDGGQTWHAATLGPERGSAWRSFSWTWQAHQPGSIQLMARAQDSAGLIQPTIGEWNRLGYANNAIQTITVVVA